MKTLTELDTEQLAEVQGGGDSFAYDVGQFFGGGAGWVRANLGTYFLLGPGIGGMVAVYHGFQESNR